ncbi:hypothetical protein [Nocardia farcinica]|uniref:hypothetical protein n=1 Tax=Nocardia farcinica TaxID=37329 RepID=UPI0024540C54|nr:hypothetical protein [Nocardia farcinica]
MSERLVVIGADATGMAAASQARRMLGPRELEIVVFERGGFTSYSACGIPYWVGGVVTERDALIARTAEEHRARDIDLRMRTEAIELDVTGRGGGGGARRGGGAAGSRARRPDRARTARGAARLIRAVPVGNTVTRPRPLPLEWPI